jgi:hypothetical protein
VRRTRLIWFAAGAAVCAAVTISFNLLASSGGAPQPYLSVSERDLLSDEIDHLESVAQTSGALLRECGAKRFYMKAANGVDGVPYSLIKIEQENHLAIHCVFERAAREGFPLHIQMITDQHAQKN